MLFAISLQFWSVRDAIANIYSVVGEGITPGAAEASREMEEQMGIKSKREEKEFNKNKEKQKEKEKESDEGKLCVKTPQSFCFISIGVQKKQAVCYRRASRKAKCDLIN